MFSLYLCLKQLQSLLFADIFPCTITLYIVFGFLNLHTNTIDVKNAKVMYSYLKIQVPIFQAFSAANLNHIETKTMQQDLLQNRLFTVDTMVGIIIKDLKEIHCHIAQ